MTRRQTGIAGELARSEAISQAHPAAHVPPRAGILNTAAQRLTRRGMMAAKAELANNVLLSLVHLLYEPDTDGKIANVDSIGGRVLVPLPWGRMGCQQWGLRASEGRALRHIMRGRAAVIDPAPLLDYDAGARHWHLTLGAYPSVRRALVYLERYPVTIDEWRAAWRATRSTWAAQNMSNE